MHEILYCARCGNKMETSHAGKEKYYWCFICGFGFNVRSKNSYLYAERGRQRRFQVLEEIIAESEAKLKQEEIDPCIKTRIAERLQRTLKSLAGFREEEKERINNIQKMLNYPLTKTQISQLTPFGHSLF